MKNMSKHQKAAVFAGLAVIFGLFFSGPVLRLFNLSNEDQTTNSNENNKPMSQTGVQTQDVVVGQGAVAEPGDKLTVHYVGTLTNGQVFDSSRDRNTPFSFTLGVGQVIRGWEEGFVGMRVGGKRTISVAPDYGYGDQAVGAIPANSILIFDVELLDVQKSQ